MEGAPPKLREIKSLERRPQCVWCGDPKSDQKHPKTEPNAPKVYSNIPKMNRNIPKRIRTPLN